MRIDRLVKRLAPVLPIFFAASLFARETGTQPNVIFVLIDTLRSDHVGSYGYERNTTPVIDTLAREGMLFENAIAQAPWTMPSIASMWTSRNPSETGVGALSNDESVRNFDDRSASAFAYPGPTLAESLQRAGYATFAVIANPYVSEHFNMVRGFDDVNANDGAARPLVDAFLDELDDRLPPAVEKAKPLFGYIHFMDAHAPTDPPEPYASMFPTIDGKPHEPAHANWQYGDARDADAAAFTAFLSHKIALYDGAIAYIDAEIGRMIGHLRETGILENTVIVITADHGEEFWDHKGFWPKFYSDPRKPLDHGHGHSLFSELLHVPLIMWGPGIPQRKVGEQVRNLDIMPTLLALAGSDVASTDMRGTNLVAHVCGGRVPSWLCSTRVSRWLRSDDLEAFSEELAYGYEAKAVSDGAYKYIKYVDAPTAPAFAFDMRRDPSERHDLMADASAPGVRLAKRLDELVAANRALAKSSVDIDQETAARLRGLGYME